MINNLSLNAFSYNSLFTPGNTGRKLTVPVRPSMVVYTQFDHIYGVAAKQGQAGVPVNKIKILNTLIDQLVTMKRSAGADRAPLPSGDAEIDALIKNYQNEIKQIVRQAGRNPYALPGRAPETGVVFSITA
jgi:hypothetical protein